MSEVAGLYENLVRWWRHLPEKERQELLEEQFPIVFSYNSGKIENDEITIHDTVELFEKGRLLSFTGDVRTVFEIENLKRSWAQTMRFGQSDKPLCVEDLLAIQETLTRGTYDERRWERGERPGTFKIGAYVVGFDVGYEPEDVRDAICDLVEQLGNVMSCGDALSAQRAITVASWAHAMLAEIHPFADGNGRTARALTNVLGLRADIPPMVVYEEDRMAYYGALDAFHEDGSLDSFKTFLMVESLKTWKSYVEA